MLFSRNVISVEEVISVKMTFTKPFSESLIASFTNKLPGQKGRLKPPRIWPNLCPHSRHFILKLAPSPLDGKGISLVPGWFLISLSSHVLTKYIRVKPREKKDHIKLPLRALA